MVLSYNAENVSGLIKKDFSVYVFIDNKSTQEQVEKVKEEVSKVDNIDTYEYETKKQVAEDFKKSSPIFKSIIENWTDEENPFSDIIAIKVKDLNKINSTAAELKKIENVNLVKYGEGIVEQMLNILDTVGTVLVGIVVALVLVTIFLVSNTIKLTIFSRRKEIEIMRLVGASNINIKLPFVIEGLFLGVLGSLIPIILTIYGYNKLYVYMTANNISPFLQLIKPLPFIYMISLILLGIGTLVGAFGSANSVRKYLKI